MEEKAKSKKKGIIIGIIAVAAAAVAVLIIFLVKNKKEAYRVIKVYEVDGIATVTREALGVVNPYNNMLLQSGDEVFLDTGMMTLKLDEDKYVYMEEKTRLRLEASGSSANSKTTIYLEQGAITNEIQNKLSDESSYDIHTPNSIMSVRGTIYLVKVYEEEGVRYTKVTVFEGAVSTNLVYSDGTVSDKEVRVNKGKEVIIYEDENTTDYLGDVTDIDYSQLSDEVLKYLGELVDDGVDIGITPEEIDRYLNGPFTVTFLYNGAVFGTQEVMKNKCASEPVLMPEPSGRWNFDFTTPIVRDTEIEWK